MDCRCDVIEKREQCRVLKQAGQALQHRRDEAVDLLHQGDRLGDGRLANPLFFFPGPAFGKVTADGDRLVTVRGRSGMPASRALRRMAR